MCEILSPAALEGILKQAQSDYKTALVAKRSGDVSSARRALLKAAEGLLLAAQSSRGPLKESRKALGQQLMEQASAMQETVTTPAPGDLSKLTQGLSAEEKEQLDSWLIQDRPTLRFDDIAGLDEVKHQIRLKLLYPFQHPDLAHSYGIHPGGGLLLYGPPGTGKTMIARAVAGEIEAAFFAIKPSEIMSQWVGVAEQNIQKLFALADAFPISVIFIDEIEALTPKRRGSSSTVMQRVVPQILSEMDGFENRQNTLLMIGATNEPWAIDTALLRPGRLDRMIYIAPPDEAARKRILELNLANKPLAADVSLAALAARTRGFSGADMAALAQRAAERAFFQAITSEDTRHITQEDFDSVLSTMHSSIDEKDSSRFEVFRQGQ
jgi:transitional endoplasmic reticulum ATPase